MKDLRARLQIPAERLASLNAVLADPEIRVVQEMLDVVARYGTPEQINARAQAARRQEALLAQVEASRPEYLRELAWLQEQRDRGAFTTITAYRSKVLGPRAAGMEFREENAVTLEVSALQYFPWVIACAEKAIAEQSLMPGRWIKVRRMKEQEADGDLPAIAAAMHIIGASYVETLDTKGTDGSNLHLNGPETITGYFGGIGQPNEHALLWLDEFLYYYTHYGVQQVLNFNAGTILLGFLLHRLGVDIEFKISVFFGSDNPYNALWILMMARLLSRDDGTTPLIGFNWSNSVDNRTMELTADFRKKLGLEDIVRFEHHITETWKSIVRQPYDRRAELVQLAARVANISAKHEGGDPEIDSRRDHPSDILDYFREKAEVVAAGDWENLRTNFLDKYDAANHTACALTENGLSFIPARNLHRPD